MLNNRVIRLQCSWRMVKQSMPVIIQFYLERNPITKLIIHFLLRKFVNFKKPFALMVKKMNFDIYDHPSGCLHLAK